MTASESTALQPKDKAEMTASAEQTRPGLVFLPAVDIFETENDITLLADMPGVAAENLDVDLDKDVLTINGSVASPEGEGEQDLIREYRTGQFHRKFTLAQVIDKSKIDAELKEGVLRLRLPKVEEATPRRITVKAG